MSCTSVPRDGLARRGTRGTRARVKDLIEEELFARHLFTSLDLVFFDTTSLFFTGNGGDTLGQYGKSKDHRDCKQMVLGRGRGRRCAARCGPATPPTSPRSTKWLTAKSLRGASGVPGR